MPRDSTSGRQKADSDSGVFIHGHGFAGIIFPSNMKAHQDQFPRGTRYWTPSESDVLMAEHELVPYLQQSGNPGVKEILKALGTYKHQYIGIVSGGHRQIYINFFCDTDKSDVWKSREIVVLDGGPCYFNLRYSVESKTFSNLRINGRA